MAGDIIEQRLLAEFTYLEWTTASADGVINELREKCKMQSQSQDKQQRAYNITLERIIEHIQWFRKNKAQLIDTNEKCKKRNQNTLLTERITKVMATKQPNLEIVTEILAIKKEMDDLKSTIKKDILQQQLTLLNDILAEITMTSNIPIKKLMTILKCMHGICEDKMWSEFSANARKMIVKHINSSLATSDKWTETMTGNDRLVLVNKIAVIYSLLSSISISDSSHGTKRDMVYNDDYLKKKKMNWFSY